MKNKHLRDAAAGAGIGTAIVLALLLGALIFPYGLVKAIAGVTTLYILAGSFLPYIGIHVPGPWGNNRRTAKHDDSDSENQPNNSQATTQPQHS